MRKLGNSMLMPVVGAVRRVASSRLAIAAFAVTVTAAVVGGVAAASIPDNAGVIHSCYNHSDGTLRVVDSPGARCKPGEVPLPWNQTGLQGPAGATGPAGAPAQTGVAITKVIPPSPDFDNPLFVPLTLHLATGTWHVTAETNGLTSQFPNCFFSETTGTLLGDVAGIGTDVQNFLVDVSAASATVTVTCEGDIQGVVTHSANVVAVPVVMQQPS